MTTSKQRTAARRNIKSAAKAAKRKRAFAQKDKDRSRQGRCKGGGGNVNSSNDMRRTDFRIDASRVVTQKIVSWKFDAHAALHILLELQNAECVQFPAWVLDFSGNEPSSACRIEPKSR